MRRFFTGVGTALVIRGEESVPRGGRRRPSLNNLKQRIGAAG
jgi:hypothetical protein